MDILLSWGVSLIDTIFSTRQESPGEKKCPYGTTPAGYIRDEFYNKWQQLCLTSLTVEDAEDVFIIVLVIIGFLLTWIFLALFMYFVWTRLTQVRNREAPFYNFRMLRAGPEPEGV